MPARGVDDQQDRSDQGAGSGRRATTTYTPSELRRRSGSSPCRMDHADGADPGHPAGVRHQSAQRCFVDPGNQPEGRDHQHVDEHRYAQRRAGDEPRGAKNFADVDGDRDDARPASAAAAPASATKKSVQSSASPSPPPRRRAADGRSPSRPVRHVEGKSSLQHPERPRVAGEAEVPQQVCESQPSVQPPRAVLALRRGQQHQRLRDAGDERTQQRLAESPALRVGTDVQLR